MIVIRIRTGLGKCKRIRLAGRDLAGAGIVPDAGIFRMRRVIVRRHIHRGRAIIYPTHRLTEGNRQACRAESAIRDVNHARCTASGV